MTHKSVLLNEVVDFFKDCSGIIVDSTLGLGGHSYELLKNNKNIQIIGIDRDVASLNFAKERLSEFSTRFSCIKSNFSFGIKKIIEENQNISGILADIGVSSPQFDNLERGFSFESESLDMRMDLDTTINAEIIVNSYSKDELNRIFFEYGEIKNPNIYTKLILDYRKNKMITSARELSNLIANNFKANSRIHPATLIFQALRIEVNNELGELRDFLKNIENLKSTKIAIISFHSLEDRIVKETFKKWIKDCCCEANVMKCECGNNNARGVIINKKPIIPTNSEIAYNRRSRSAKMRCFRFNE